jgi:hypothetical protein
MSNTEMSEAMSLFGSITDVSAPYRVGLQSAKNRHWLPVGAATRCAEEAGPRRQGEEVRA